MRFLRQFSENKRPRHRRADDWGAAAPHIVVGVTSPQTCLVLRRRLRFLRDAGFRVTLLSGPGQLLDQVGNEEGVDTCAVAMEREIAPVKDAISLLRLFWAMRALRPDVVEFSTPKAGLLGLFAALLAGVPKRVYLLRGLKMETATGIKRSILLAAEVFTAACAHAVVCNSESLRQQAIAYGIAHPSMLKMLGAGSSVGVDVERFSPGEGNVRRQLGIPEDASVIGFVGRLTRDKGVPELVEAFERIAREWSNAYLLLVGWFDQAEDALDAATRARIKKQPRIVCTGFVGDAAPYYRAMDMMVLPSWREGLPNAVLEASASGIPVVTTLSTGARDAVLPEVTGFLVPPGCPEAIYEAVDRLLGDPMLRRLMGAAGRRWVIEKFASEHVLGLNAQFYKSLLTHGSGWVLRPQHAMELSARQR